MRAISSLTRLARDVSLRSASPADITLWHSRAGSAPTSLPREVPALSPLPSGKVPRLPTRRKGLRTTTAWPAANRFASRPTTPPREGPAHPTLYLTQLRDRARSDCLAAAMPSVRQTPGTAAWTREDARRPRSAAEQRVLLSGPGGPPTPGYDPSEGALSSPLSELGNALRAWSLADRRALLFEPVSPPVTEHDPRADPHVSKSLAERSRDTSRKLLVALRSGLAEALARFLA